MKRKAYIVPAVETHKISIQHMICKSIIDVTGDAYIEPGEGDPEPSGGGDTRRRSEWDDEDEYDY